MSVLKDHIFVLYYPPGTSLYKGVEKDNAIIASEILTALRTGKMDVQFPRPVTWFDDATAAASIQGWELQIMAPHGSRRQDLIQMVAALASRDEKHDAHELVSRAEKLLAVIDTREADWHLRIQEAIAKCPI